MFNWIRNFFTQKNNNKIAKEYNVSNTPLSPKEIATASKEPWVAVLNTSINPTNPKNGFFDLDWNEYFIESLRENGYTGATDEEIINQWFGDLCREIGQEEGIPMDRRWSGFVDVKNLGNGRSEIG